MAMWKYLATLNDMNVFTSVTGVYVISHLQLTIGYLNFGFWESKPNAYFTQPMISLMNAIVNKVVSLFKMSKFEILFLQGSLI